MISRRRALALSAALLTTLWFVLAGTAPASAAEGMHGPRLDEIDSYCKQLPGGTGVVVAPPGNAYSYFCKINGRSTAINMTSVCRWTNGNDLTVYDRVDLPRFDHPDNVDTGWTCYRFDFNPTSPGQKLDLDRYCAETAAPSVGAVLVSPNHANDWHCKGADGTASQWTISMDDVCRHQNSVVWTDRTLNVYDGGSVYCYR
jgi:hypothetical protein